MSEVVAKAPSETPDTALWRMEARLWRRSLPPVVAIVLSLLALVSFLAIVGVFIFLGMAGAGDRMLGNDLFGSSVAVLGLSVSVMAVARALLAASDASQEARRWEFEGEELHQLVAAYPSTVRKLESGESSDESP